MRCEHGVYPVEACAECSPSALEPPVPLCEPSDDIDVLRGQLYATQCLLLAERERAAHLRRCLEYEAFLANREFAALVRSPGG